MAFSDRPNLVIHGYVPETNAILPSPDFSVNSISVCPAKSTRKRTAHIQDQALLLVGEHRLVSVRSSIDDRHSGNNPSKYANACDFRSIKVLIRNYTFPIGLAGILF